MTAQTGFQILTMVGIFFTAIGGIGSYIASNIETQKKERIANERIDELQTALTISVKENAELVKEFTKETVEETAVKIRKSEMLDEARKKLQKERMVSKGQRKAIGIR